METNQGTSLPYEPRADTSYVHQKFKSLIDMTYEKLKEVYVIEMPTTARGWAAAMVLLWEDLKKLLMEEYCQDDAV
ncbi:hypothetical protein Tco_1024495 [Tanacetum coccineum]